MGWKGFGMDVKEGRIRESDKDGVSPNVRRSHQGLNCWAQRLVIERKMTTRFTFRKDAYSGNCDTVTK